MKMIQILINIHRNNNNIKLWVVLFTRSRSLFFYFVVLRERHVENVSFFFCPFTRTYTHTQKHTEHKKISTKKSIL